MLKKINLIVCDAENEWRARVDFEIVMAIIGSLSADPMTLGELHRATARFMVPRHRDRLFRRAKRRPGIDLDDPGCVIDLAARLLVTPWEHASGIHVAPYLDDDGPLEFPLGYHLSDSWRFTQQFRDWRQVSQQRRDSQSEFLQVLDRFTLYETPMLMFLAQECSRWAERLDPSVFRQPEDDSVWLEGDAMQRVLRKTHAEWLLNIPAGWSRSVREAILVDEVHLEADLQSRMMQWMIMKDPPVGLSEQDTAFEASSFSGNEFRLYHQLVRSVIRECLLELRASRVKGRCEPLGQQIQKLRAASRRWLECADHPSLMQKSPAEIIQQQRQRIPLGTKPGEMLDCDCPMCRLMIHEDDPSPSFWFVPAVNIEPYFPFRSDSAVGPTDALFRSLDESAVDSGGASSSETSDVWTTVQLGSCEDLAPKERLFIVAACTAELIQDIRHRVDDSGEAIREVEQLNGMIDNLAAEMKEVESPLLDVVVQRFCECLDELTETHPDLTYKFADLQNRIVTLWQTSAT